MTSRVTKLRTEMTKRMDQENTSMTAHRDYDFERRSTDMKRLAHALGHFDHAVTQGMVAMKEIASAFEAVGQAFTELTLGTASTASHDEEEPIPFPTENEDLSAYNNTSANFDTPEGSQQRRRHVDTHGESSGERDASSMPQYAQSVASTRLTDETNSQVRRLAQMFAEETRRINEGQPFQTYNAGMHRDVVTRLRPVAEHLKSVDEYRQKRTEALDRYNKHKAEVEKVEKRCAKRGKPFCDSKSHKKSVEKRDASWNEYTKRRQKFNDTFSMLMEVNDHAAAQIIHRYLALNDEYLRQLVASIGRILPAMSEAYPLNQEYTTAQNSMILEAVAQAKTPFARHCAKAAEGEGEGEGEGAEVSSIPADEKRAQDDLEEGSSSSSLEEPTDDAASVGHGPLMGDDSNNHQPPHEDEGASDSDSRIHAAGNTGIEPGYAVTQPMRLRTGDEPRDDDGTPYPGAVAQ